MLSEVLKSGTAATENLNFRQLLAECGGTGPLVLRWLPLVVHARIIQRIVHVRVALTFIYTVHLLSTI